MMRLGQDSLRSTTTRLWLCNLDRLCRAAGFTRHAEYAVRLPCGVGLVRPDAVSHSGVPFSTIFSLPGPGLSRVQHPLEDEDRTHVHAHAVRDARLKVDCDGGPMNPVLASGRASRPRRAAPCPRPRPCAPRARPSEETPRASVRTLGRWPWSCSRLREPL